MGLLDELKKLNPEWFPVKPKSVTDGFRYGFPEPEEFQPSDAISAPTIAGGLLSLDPTDYVGPNTLAKGAAAIKGLLGATAAKATAIPVMAGIFAGKSAKTADLVKQGLAEKMLKAGEDPAKVWKETGWGIGPDGKWRFEIPDNTANPKMTTGKMEAEADRSRLYMTRTFKHDPLYAAYPDSQTIGVRVGQGNGASYDPANDAINYLVHDPRGQNIVNPDVTLHELQHAIQQREGFARGGSPEQFKVSQQAMEGMHTPDDMMRAELVMQRAKEYGLTVSDFAKNPPRWLDEKALAIAKRFENKPSDFEYAKNYVMGAHDPNDAYKRLAGEAESRLTQSRMNMDAGQRAAQYPWEPGYFQEATGVPLNGLLYRYE